MESSKKGRIVGVVLVYMGSLCILTMVAMAIRARIDVTFPAYASLPAGIALIAIGFYLTLSTLIHQIEPSRNKNNADDNNNGS